MDDVLALRLEVAALRREVAAIATRGQLTGGVLGLYLGGQYGDVDRLLPYGFASTPVDGTEAVGRINGDSAIILGDLHAGRPTPAKGEVTIYDRYGNSVALGASGITVNAVGDCEVNASGNVLLQGATGLPAEIVMVAGAGPNPVPCSGVYAPVGGP